MKISTDENNTIIIEEIYNGIILKTKDDEKITIFMRDSGFEFKYKDKWYFAKNGYLEPFHKSIRNNILVNQFHKDDQDVSNKL